ncbi:MAG: amidohydrolase [Rubripirellula sp.]|nr:amidohydrolase [Rubripirellula sp.]
MIEATSDWISTVLEYCDQFHDDRVVMRRYLHQHPELSEQEFMTTEFLTAALAKLDLPTHVPGEGRGVIADLITSPTVADGPRIAIRGDIDALPIADSKSVDYRSQVDGVMHACGHDVHASVVVGAMQILVAMHRDGKLPWPIAVRAILQPAEEMATGARHMIHHHALRDITSIVALHVDPTRSVGCIGLRTGHFTAACDSIHVSFRGKGGHGARPHLTQDPIDACTHWVQSAFRRIARTANPHETVVFSIGQIEAGHSVNVIPDTAKVDGSLRSLDKESRSLALETLEDVCESIARESGCQVEMTMGYSAPAVINDRATIELLADSVKQALSPGAIEWIDQSSMGSEDFSYYLDHVPGAMFRLGVAGSQVGHAPLHTSAFDIDEEALAVGSKLFAATVINHFDPARAGSR